MIFHSMDTHSLSMCAKGHTCRVVFLVNSVGVDATNKENIAIILYKNTYVAYSEIAYMFFLKFSVI